MRVALTIWEERISPVCDVSREALVLDVDGKGIASESREAIAAPDDLSKAARLEALGIEALVCGAISEPLRRELTARGISVTGFVSGKVDDVVRAFLRGELPSPALTMPGCDGRGRGRKHIGEGRCHRKRGRTESE